MRARFLQHWTQSATPPWVAPLFALLAISLGVLTVVVEHGDLETPFRLETPVAGGYRPTPLSVAIIGVFIVVWLLETGGLRWPRLLFVLTALAPASVLIYAGRTAVAPLLPMLVVIWVTYVGSRRQSVLTLILALGSILPPFVTGHAEGKNLAPWTIGLVTLWAAGAALARQQRLLDEHQRLLADLRAAQADLARQAAADERRRIAREVHDVIAHSLAITLLHLTGARHILQRNPQRAAEALAQAEVLGRQSMTDIRQVVGLLGADSNAGTAAPLPGASDIAGLVADFVAAGLDVHSTISGDPARLSAAAGLDLYRIAQEALANVTRHAPGAHVDLDLCIRSNDVSLRVLDSGTNRRLFPHGPSTGTGLGIVGMRERASLHHGSLAAHRDGVGWLVECVIPFDGMPEIAG
ncbi:MAG TPA: histidine kinase [Roseiflexaceae bacterium]|nr:histidine kinase [Roseiflexaceae bacterium]